MFVDEAGDSLHIIV